MKGHLVKKARKIIGLTHSELALILDVSRHTVINWERDKTTISKPCAVVLVMLVCDSSAQQYTVTGLIRKYDKGLIDEAFLESLEPTNVRSLLKEQKCQTSN
jgi:DNA-binding XRE family transcriptional regulator